ncbi:hypothetical protein HUT16_17125 [Kitasatospora sp. NA04385]|uniref:hypothetical protein n=1 Tax=Kitasatospora sp. NA04385 TaxID=2742135 RepID=UPI0015914A8E|nr:hypothetical protein [Kitasatospora sp. NA04385]QKW20560.1 hypothetical protein HUT16_17125 [Kitasatospora sp. NA04385]
MTPPHGPVADLLARLPLTPRTRWAAPPLHQRVTDLHARARRASRGKSATTAGTVLHQAAVLLADLGRLPQALELSAEHTRLWAARRPLSAETARQALAPQSTAAALLVRARRAEDALALCAEITRALAEDDAAALPHGPLPLARITDDDGDRENVGNWWAAAQAEHGARALALQGHWEQAHLHTKTARGASPQSGLLYARQIAVIAMAVQGHPDLARHLIDDTRPTTPWERVVAEVLRVLCALIGQDTPDEQMLDRMFTTHDAITPRSRDPLWDTELWLALVDTAAAAGRPACGLHRYAADWVKRSGDGYSAAALLEHRLAQHLDEKNRDALTRLTDAAGLGTKPPPARTERRIDEAIGLATATLAAAT